MIQRLDQLIAPVQVGTAYLVPTVRGKWEGTVRNWPVIGPQHNDKQCLNFEPDHYHLDVRFLPGFVDNPKKLWWRYAFSSPLQIGPDGQRGVFPPIVWLRRVCMREIGPRRDDVVALVSAHRSWQCHFDQWTGKQARHDGRGWVCPHRSVPLADHVAQDGVITCPLHLLRIDAATGRVLPPRAVPA